MESPNFFAATLGLSHPWQISSVSFAKDEKRMDITICFSGDGIVLCPTCGKEVTTCTMESETWFHNNFLRYETYLHASVPCIQCPCCGMLTVERPWSRAGSKFTRIQ